MPLQEILPSLLLMLLILLLDLAPDLGLQQRPLARIRSKIMIKSRRN